MSQIGTLEQGQTTDERNVPPNDNAPSRSSTPGVSVTAEVVSASSDGESNVTTTLLVDPILEGAPPTKDAAPHSGGAKTSTLITSDVTHEPQFIQDPIQPYDAISPCLVIVDIDSGAGSGSAFVVRMGSKRYILTNGHVVRGAKRIAFTFADGRRYSPNVVELANNADLARIPIDAVDIPSLSVSTTPPTMGEDITVYGNSLGGGVHTTLAGKVLGIGPREVEVSADFVYGNSGSPIINSNREVIAVATYASLPNPNAEPVVRGTRFAQVRRFGLRICDDTQWVPVRLNQYQVLAKALAETDAYLYSVMAIMLCWVDGPHRTESVRSFREKLFKPQTRHYRESPWDNRLERFADTYVKYWDARGRLAQKSSSVVLGEQSCAVQLIALLRAPVSNLKALSCPTKDMRQIVDDRLELIGFLEQQATKITKSSQWDLNIIKYDPPTVYRRYEGYYPKY